MNDPKTETAPIDPKKILDDLLGKHAQIIIFAYPAACSGLEAFPADRPLRLNLGYALKPDMCIATDDEGVSFVASFSGAPTSVRVPWTGLLFAGTEANFAECVKKAIAMQREAERPKTEQAPGSNVVHVDFAARGKKRA